MDLTRQAKLALMGLLGQTFLPLMCLPEQTDLLVTALKIDLLTEFRNDCIRLTSRTTK